MLERLLHDSYLGGVSHAALGGTRHNFLMSGGSDGALFLLTADGVDLTHHEVKPPAEVAPAENVEHDLYDDPAEMTSAPPPRPRPAPSHLVPPQRDARLPRTCVVAQSEHVISPAGAVRALCVLEEPSALYRLASRASYTCHHPTRRHLK